MPPRKSFRTSPATPLIPPHISEIELSTIVADRERVASISAELSKLKKVLDARESDIIDRLKKGEPVVGALGAQVDSEKGRSSPKWKDEWANLISKLGKDVTVEEARVKAEYPAPINDALTIIVPS